MLDVPADDFAPLLAEIRAVGQARLRGNTACFMRIAEKAERLAAQGRDDEACVQVFIAAFHAVARHSGLWASPRLEALLARIAVRRLRNAPGRRAPGAIRHVMHVATQVPALGGLARMMERWIRADVSRTHSVAITRQAIMPLPESIRDAVTQSGGTVRILDHGRGGLFERAQRLRDAAQGADLVVLHIYPFDIVPQLAFATPNRPAVVFLDHADHSFWLGIHITDVMASMREAGQRIMIERRGIPPERIALPTILDEGHRRVSRQEAKRRIGVPEDCVLLASVARGRKYVTLGGRASPISTCRRCWSIRRQYCSSSGRARARTGPRRCSAASASSAARARRSAPVLRGGGRLRRFLPSADHLDARSRDPRHAGGQPVSLRARFGRARLQHAGADDCWSPGSRRAYHRGAIAVITDESSP